MATVRLLGRIEAVDAGGSPIPLRMKSIEIIAYLAYRSDVAISRREIADALWPDLEESRRRHNLRQNLLYLRQALPDLIVSSGENRLGLADADIDLRSFRRLCDQGTRTRQHSTLEEAVALYAGELLPGLDSEWAEVARTVLDEEHLAARLQLANHYSSQDPALCAHHAGKAIEQDPLLEAPRKLKIQALIAMGETAVAVRAVDEYQALLKTEIGFDLSEQFLAEVGLPTASLGQEAIDPVGLSPNQILRLETALAPGRNARGENTFGHRALRLALDKADPPAEVHAHALLALSRFSFDAGEMARSLAEAEAASRLAKLRTTKASALIGIARVLVVTGRVEAADSHADVAIGAATTAKDLEVQAEALTIKGITLWYLHKTAEATAANQQAVRVARRAHSPIHLVRALSGLAACRFKAGDLAGAVRALEESIRVSDGARMSSRAAHARGTLGRVIEAKGDLTRAESLYVEAATALDHTESPSIVGHVVTYLGDLRLKKGDPAGSVREHKKGLALRRVLGDRLGMATSLRGIGKALNASREFGEARAALEQALRIYRSVEDKIGVATALIPLAESLVGIGARSLALRWLDEAGSVLEGLDRAQFATTFEDEMVSLEAIGQLRARALALAPEQAAT